jgi:hypothetical protein
MATEKIKCPACGFGALLFTTGETTRLTVDSATQIRVCNRFKHQPKSDTSRIDPLDCHDFREALQRPAKNNNSGSPSLDDETAGEEAGAKEAAPEKSSNKSAARSPKSRPAQVAKTQAGSPKARSARRQPRKSTLQKTAHSAAPVMLTESEGAGQAKADPMLSMAQP